LNSDVKKIEGNPEVDCLFVDKINYLLYRPNGLRTYMHVDMHPHTEQVLGLFWKFFPFESRRKTKTLAGFLVSSCWNFAALRNINRMKAAVPFPSLLCFVFLVTSYVTKHNKNWKMQRSEYQIGYGVGLRGFVVICWCTYYDCIYWGLANDL